MTLCRNRFQHKHPIAGVTHSFDSAEKPRMVKKEHLKTPPKQSDHSEKDALNQSWRFICLTPFSCFLWFSKKTGGFSAESMSTV
jgi:hypothetical protein